MRKSRDVTDAELAVLEALWQRESATIRQLTDDIYPNGTAANFSSVQKLLERLEAKRFVKRKRSGSVTIFRPSVTRRELIGRRLTAVAESLCDGSLTPLLEHLIEEHDLDAADHQRLSEMIERLATKKASTRD